MFPSPSFPWFELARFRRSRLTRAAVIAVMLVPLFYGALYVWANFDPTGNLDKVDAAIVNQDQLVKIADSDGKKEPIAIGRELAGNLISNDSKNNYDWTLTDAKDAKDGLASGRYRAVLTIPKDLSKAATSTSDGPKEAIQGKLDLKTNDAVNYINGKLAKSILEAAKSALNNQVTSTYLDNVYLSFSDIKASLSDASDGAGKLADGAGKLADGAGKLADGTHQLADGARQLEDGSAKLSSGLGTLSSRTKNLPRDTRRLADGSAQVADGTAQINAITQRVSSVVIGATNTANAQSDAFRTTLQKTAEGCDAKSTPNLCEQLNKAVADFDDLSKQFNIPAQKAQELSGQTQKLSTGAAAVAAGNKKLADSTPQLVDGINQAASGAKQLGTGAQKLNAGATDAAAGADALKSGADKLEAGAQKLESGLSAGADKVPDYNKGQRKTMAKTVATPVTQDTGHLNSVANYGGGLAPYFISLALWVGAMAIYLILRPLSKRAIASTASNLRVALAGFAPGAALSVIQAGLLVVVLAFVVGVDVANLPLVLGLAFMTAVTFTAINQMLIAVFGPAGRFIAIVFLCLQLTAAGGTYPIETAPSFFGAMHGLLPMSYAVEGLRAAIAGSHAGIPADFFALAVWGVLAIVVTVIAAQRQRMITMKTLHPTLEV